MSENNYTIIKGPEANGSREASGWFDSAADQRALRNGYGHFEPIKPYKPVWSQLKSPKW